MKIITSVIRERNRVQIDLDGRFYMKLRASDYEKLPLFEGDELDEQEFEDRLSAIQYEEAYEAALTQLDYSQRTRAEIRKKLSAKGFAAPAIEAVIERLSDARLLNDAAYAQYVAESLSRKPIGLYAARQKLRAKGFTDEDAENALESQLDDEQQANMALALAKKLAPKYIGKGDPRAAKNKLSQAIARRGFSWEHVKSAVDAVMNDDGDDLDW